MTGRMREDRTARSRRWVGLVAMAAAGLPGLLLAQAPKPAPVKPLQTMVWVKSGTRVYHCPGGQQFGTTRDGEYMTESAARARGNRAAQGTGCPASAGRQIPLVPAGRRDCG